MVSHFRNRSDAGRLLARASGHYASRDDVVVLGLAPAGIPVAFEIATALHAPLDIFVVRALVTPDRGGSLMGALATGGVRVLEPHVVTRHHPSRASIESASLREWQELVQAEQTLRGDRRPRPISGMVAILVDDGTARSATLRAAVLALRRQDPGRVVLATPSLASSSCDELSTLVDEILCAATPEPFFSAASRYADAPPVSEGDVRRLMEQANRDPLFAASGLRAY